jgi:hypothetical protein
MTITNLRTLALGAFALAAAVSLESGKASAEVEYPWCAAYTGKDRGVVTCGFVTWDQCMATVSGVGGFCQRNPRLAYAPDPQRPRRVR